jgi:hypothetical protein
MQGRLASLARWANNDNGVRDRMHSSPLLYGCFALDFVLSWTLKTIWQHKHAKHMCLSTYVYI